MSIEGYESTKEAAARLGVTEGHVRLLAGKGRLEAVKAGRDWLVKKDSWPRETGLGRKPKWANKAMLAKEGR